MMHNIPTLSLSLFPLSCQHHSTAPPLRSQDKSVSYRPGLLPQVVIQLMAPVMPPPQA